MFSNMKKFKCPYCGGRLFDYIEDIDYIEEYWHYPRLNMMIKCWKCHVLVEIKY